MRLSLLPWTGLLVGPVGSAEAEPGSLLKQAHVAPAPVVAEMWAKLMAPRWASASCPYRAEEPARRNRGRVRSLAPRHAHRALSSS